jgi:hypothetical protein
MIDLHEQLAWIRSNLDLSFKNGTYITGSFLTYLIELEYRTPTWFPKDIDICCPYKKFDELDKFLRTKTKTTKSWETDQGLKNTYYHLPNFIRISVQPTVMNFKRRAEWTDYSIVALTGDGTNLYTTEFTKQDILDKRLRAVRSLDADANCDSMLLDRYRKYIDRGFFDQDNKILNSINEFMSKK